MSNDSFQCVKKISINNQEYSYFSLAEAQKNGLNEIQCLPRTLKILMENLLRSEGKGSTTKRDLCAMNEWVKEQKLEREIGFFPGRIIMQDFTGVPALVDLAAMRDTADEWGGDPLKINPVVPVDLVIDHSITVDFYGNNEAKHKNMELEYERNNERYQFIKWGEQAFNNFRVVPPGKGIVHQINLEYFGQVVSLQKIEGVEYVCFDTCVGTDSHTTMIGGLGILGWGVGGIEAESIMLGSPLSINIPEVVGFKLTGRLKEGITATDLVLTITETLRKVGVVDMMVEFFGDGLDFLSLADRATIANMAPEFGAICGYFPIDQETLMYLRLSGRDEQHVLLIEAYAKEQGVWRETKAQRLAPFEPTWPIFTSLIELALESVEACLAGPRNPEDRVPLSQVPNKFLGDLPKIFKIPPGHFSDKIQVPEKDYDLSHGTVCIAAITSCTNTSNPSVILAAGLVAKKAVEKGLRCPPWVKTSLAPGSRVVSDYLIESGLQKYLDQLGFQVVGHGCTTCIGNSGPLQPELAQILSNSDLVTVSVLSGNRNFDGRINLSTKASFLASPPLVVLYALIGHLNCDLTTTSFGQDPEGKEIFLKDLWPTRQEIEQMKNQFLNPALFIKNYSEVFQGDLKWQQVAVGKGQLYNWNPFSTYIQPPSFLKGINKNIPPLSDIIQARLLILLKDSISTDHISPAGNISLDSEAAAYLVERQVLPAHFNSYGSRRGNGEVMVRGTFANTRLKNLLNDEKEGSFTKLFPTGKVMSIYQASLAYKREGVPTVIIAGKNYGAGSSRDWAAKGTLLLGVKAVMAESFERIHRSNLVGMGILPLEFLPGENRVSLQITGEEMFTILGLAYLKVKSKIAVEMMKPDGQKISFEMKSRVDTEEELACFQHGGILNKVLRKLYT